MGVCGANVEEVDGRKRYRLGRRWLSFPGDQRLDRGMRRLLGLVLLIPLAGMISVAAPTCSRGSVRGAAGPGLGSEWLNNLAALGLMVSVGVAVAGLVLLFGPPKRSDDRGGGAS